MRTAILLALAFAAAGHIAARDDKPDALWVTRPVPGYLVSLSIQAEPPSGAKGQARHAGDMPHRLRIQIGPQAAQDAVEVSGLSIDIAEQGYAGATIAAERSRSARQVEYEARAVLRPGTSYRILLRFDPPDGSRTREALFDYRHHH